MRQWKRLAWMVLGVVPALLAVEKRWLDEAKTLQGAIPKEWSVQSLKGDTLILREEGKKPPAFINIVSSPKSEASDLATYMEKRLAILKVTPEGKPEKEDLKGLSALRATAPVVIPGSSMRLLDLLLFVEGKERYYTVMMTCLPKDRAAYAPVFDEFVAEIEFTS